MKKNKLTKDIKIKLVISITLVMLLILSFFFAGSIEKFLGLTIKIRTNQVDIQSVENSDYYVSYLDVGQGNSSFIMLPDGKTVLIDGGDASYGKVVGEFLTSHNVMTIDYLIATHSDSDHIGGLNYVLENFEVKNIYRPFQIAGTGTNSENFEVYEYEDLGNVYNKINEDTNHKSKISRVTTNVYKTFIYNIYNETFVEEGVEFDSTVFVFYDGLVISGDNYKIEFFAPLVRDVSYNLLDFCDNTLGYATKGYGVDETNDNSAIFLFECFDDYYLFSGDASFNSEGKGSNKSEDDLIESLTTEEIMLFSKVSVYLLGHHGSKYSSGVELLNLITPEFVVVSSGNQYGHPADETLERLKVLNSLKEDYLVRTDECGTITFSSVDGSLKYSLEKTDIKNELMISWYELGTIIVVFSVFIIFSARTRKDSNGL